MRSRCRGPKSIPGGGTSLKSHKLWGAAKKKKEKKKKKQWFVVDFFLWNTASKDILGKKNYMADYFK